MITINGASACSTSLLHAPTRERAEANHHKALPITISDGFLAEVLKPYRAHTTYLKSAEITHFHDGAALQDASSKPALISGKGRFSISESCYIDDTGHFNAVEFNICFNQLAYVMFAKSLEVGLMHQLWRENGSISSLTEFKRHQLPAMLIASIDDVCFLKQMRSEDFQGELSLHEISLRGKTWFFDTTIVFSDCEGPKSKGSVLLAVNPKFTPSRD
jgi:hypothetical protein